jgi:quinolinate synthase
MNTTTDEPVAYSEARDIPPRELPDAIRTLKRELNAVVLAHFYQESEIQDVADFIGDSLELARRAKESHADVIVFAGVHFMAETAKILQPSAQVLLPDLDAGCSLAESAPAPLFRSFRALHPDHLALTYINCTAEVKALSDIVCTSSNAETILSRIPSDVPVLFSPDRNLGRYLAKKMGRPLRLWQGACTVHEQFSERKAVALRLAHPDAEFIAHPECEEAVLASADYIGSTSALLRYVRERPARSFIVATEAGILHQMRKACPEKTFIPAPPDNACACNECPYMKLNTMRKLYLCMRRRSPEIALEDSLLRRASAPIRRMLDAGGADPDRARAAIDDIRLPFVDPARPAVGRHLVPDPSTIGKR